MTNLETAALILILILASLSLIEFIRKLAKREKFNTRDVAFPFGVAALIFLFILALAFKQSIEAEEGQITNWLQILITLGLVVVTGAYAWSAHRQAKANEKMATEMQNQRYDMVRPVIDIEDVRPGPITARVYKRQTTDEEKISRNFFECVLRNYGAGAAIDVYSPQRHSNIKPDWQRIGNIQAGEHKEMVTNKSGTAFIIARKIGNQWFLVAYYRDVYGRCFESKRSVNIEGKIFKMGSLKHCKLDKQKDSELINEIWPPSNAGGNHND